MNGVVIITSPIARDTNDCPAIPVYELVYSNHDTSAVTAAAPFKYPFLVVAYDVTMANTCHDGISKIFGNV